MEKKISFEELRAMGKNIVPQEAVDLAAQLKQKADAEKAKTTIVSYIEKSGVDEKKRQALLAALNGMISKDK
jgi:hypothetical protein